MYPNRGINEQVRLRQTISLAFLPCLLVVTRGEAATVRTDVEPPNVAAAVARAAEVEVWNETVWWNTVVKNAGAKQQVRARQAGEFRRPLAAPATSSRCGGALPPCWIMQRESGGNIRAMNPSGAAGKWQIMPGTWDGYGGYASAADAPEAVQDAKARSMALCNWQPETNYCAGR